jgi:chaperonin cofactor prefoldin
MTDNKDETTFEHAVESSWAKGITRFIVPIMLGLIVFFARQSNDDIRAGLNEQLKTNATTNAKLDTLGSDVKDINTRLQYQVISQLEDLKHRNESLELRIRAIESVESPPPSRAVGGSN